LNPTGTPYRYYTELCSYYAKHQKSRQKNKDDGF